MKAENKKNLNAIGWKYGGVVALVLIVEILLQTLTARLWPDMDASASMNASLIIIFLTVDAVMLPLCFLAVRKIAKGETEKNKIPFFQYLLGLFVCVFLLIAGNILGIIFNTIATGTMNTALSNMMSSSNIWMQALVIGINAPIVEEFIFRKFLIDRLSRIGKWFAIVVSALIFAFYHGNFAQFFYALFLGLFWGYVYAKTGNVFYSMGYHIFINLSQTILITPLAMKTDLTKGFMENLPYFAMIAVIYFMAFVGFVLLIVFCRRFKLNEEGSEVRGGKIFKELFTNWGLWIMYIAAGVLFLYTIWNARVTNASINPEKIVTEISFTEVIPISEAGTEIKDYEIPLTIEEAGEYIVYVDYYDNEMPGFVTGVAIEKPDGTCIDWFTGGLARVTLLPREYEPGQYVVRFAHLLTEEEAVQWMQERGYVYPDLEVTELPYEHFGAAGDCTMNYKFILAQK